MLFLSLAGVAGGSVGIEMGMDGLVTGEFVLDKEVGGSVN